MNTQFYQVLGLNAVEDGTLYGVSVITLGVAKGHGLLIDQTTLSQVIKCGNGAKGGVKVKVGHDSGIEEIVGRLTNFRIDETETKVLADLHLFDTSPRKQFILELASKTPDAFGLSISFEGMPEVVSGQQFARCRRLRSVDFVDEPAANPDGLFETPETIKPMTSNEDPKTQSPSVEDRLSALEKSFSEFSAKFEAAYGGKETKKEEQAEVGVEPKKEEMSAVQVAQIAQFESKVLASVDAKLDALSFLIKSFGTPIAPSIATNEPAPEVTDFSELRKNPDAYRKYLVNKGILKA